MTEQYKKGNRVKDRDAREGVISGCDADSGQIISEMPTYTVEWDDGSSESLVQHDTLSHVQIGNTEFYSHEANGERLSGEVCVINRRPFVVELRDGEPDGEPVPFDEYLKDQPGFESEMLAALRKARQATL